MRFAALALLLFVQSKDEVRAVIVVNKADWPKLKDVIERYEADVAKKRGVKFDVISEDWKSPVEIREALKKAYETSKIEGAILVGKLPFMRYHTTDHADAYDDKDGAIGVCPMYYEDLDGTFATPKSGLLEAGDCKQGAHRGAEIWVSWIYPRESLDEVKKFFDKTHRYYAGELKYNGRVLLWQTLDVEPANADIKELKKVFTPDEIDHYAKDEPTIDQATGLKVLPRTDLAKVGTLTKENCPVPVWKYHGPNNPLVKQLYGLSSNFYDLYEVHYGGGYFHAYLLTEHVKVQGGSPKIVCMNACRTGQFDYKPERSIALAYIFDTQGTLAAMGPTVEASWSQLYNLVYRFMAEGDTLGRAWMRKDGLSELDETDVAPNAKTGKTTYHDHTIPAHGSCLLGDPFVTMRERR